MVTKAASAIPEGFHTLTPHLVCRDAPKALEFYKNGLGAEITSVSHGPDGRVMHSQMVIGDSVLMMSEEYPEMGSFSPLGLNGTSVTIHVYTPEPDALFQRAVAAGAKPVMPMMDAFWGDRYGQFVDPFGHRWSIAARARIMTPEEVEEEMKQAFAAWDKKKAAGQ